MSTGVNSPHSSISASSRAGSVPSGHGHPDTYGNGHIHSHDSGPSHQASSNSLKKGKQKKAADPNEHSNLIAAKISQLESDAAGDREQEAEIDREVKKATRELNNLTAKLDPLQKVDTIQRRYTELLASMKRLERDNQKNKKRADLVQKERDHAKTDLNKSAMLKDKLEKLCRELQKDNNRLKNENKTLQDTAKEEHTASDSKFKQTLWELESLQDAKDNPQAPVASVEVDELFRQRFRSLIEQYELRDTHFHSLLRAKELEVQFNMAKFDRERKLAEIEVNRSRNLNSQVLTFSKTESELRNQLNIYVEKFKQVEDTLNNSNDLFLTFRKEMEEMSKKTKRLEKENTTLTRKHDLTNQNILKMAEERSKSNMEMAALRTKNDRLTSIINQMQKQGRGVASGMAGVAERSAEPEAQFVEGGADLDRTDSEAEYEYDDEEGEDGDGEDDEGEEGSEDYNEDTEEEPHPEGPKPFGPVPPPTNGVAVINGVKH